MAPKSKGKKHNTKRPDLIETSRHGSSLILAAVRDAATFAPFSELKQAASVALLVLQTIQAVKENKEAYKRLGNDSVDLVAAIWRSYEKAKDPNEWLSADMREVLVDLTHTLQSIASFAEDQLSRNMAIRVIFSRADAGKINEYREQLNYAIQKFELQSHMNINDLLMQLVRNDESRNDVLVQVLKNTEQILDRNEEEDVKRAQEITAREYTDREEAERIHGEELKAAKEFLGVDRLNQVETDYAERRHTDELKKIEKETKEGQSELERLQTASRPQNKKGKWRENVIAVVTSSEEEEEAGRPVRSSKAKSKPSKSPKRRLVSSSDSTDDVEEDVQTRVPATSSRKKSSRLQDEEEEWQRNSVAEEARLKEEEEVRPPVRKSYKAKRNPSKSTEDEYTDSEEEEGYKRRAPRKSPKVNRNPRSSSSSLPPAVDGLMSQFRSFTPGWSEYPPMYPTTPFIGPYGYGPGTVVNSGVGNITNTTISNAGNDNSVKKVYYSNSRRRRDD
ncbi:hypothetical protein BYT27DRAFT_7262615 [Phlegmacium glaucopus]|nr:hypothetical protein BYT27DRAFT_7262615 [Phlegmacium glaucopus]